MAFPSIQVTTRSPEETRDLGRELGLRIRAGMALYLIGDLGSGKTALVQGLARGLEVPPDHYITSPTYTLVHEHPGRRPLYHIDLYRLEDEVDFEEIGLFDLPEEDAVVAVEWAERLCIEDRSEGLTIRFRIRNNDARRIHLIASGLAAEDLIKQIEKIAKEKKWA